MFRQESMKKILHIEFEDLPPTLNKFYRAHYHQAGKWKREWETILSSLLPKTIKAKPPFIVVSTAHCKRMRDVDNSVIAVKFFQDAMTKSGLLKDDNRKWIKEVRLKTEKADKNLTVLELYKE